MAEFEDEYGCDLMGDFFTIFAHPTRMRVFCSLQHGERTVSDIAEYARISMPNASQHLRLMRDKGAVVSSKKGQSVYYRIADPRLLEGAGLIRQAILERIRTQAIHAPAPLARVLPTQVEK